MDSLESGVQRRSRTWPTRLGRPERDARNWGAVGGFLRGENPIFFQKLVLQVRPLVGNYSVIEGLSDLQERSLNSQTPRSYEFFKFAGGGVGFCLTP